VSKKVVVAVTGASGSLYARVLLDKLLVLKPQWDRIGLVMSDNARVVWEHELGDRKYDEYPFDLYSKTDFNAPFASGSANYDTMIIAPCSMGTMARIANGTSNDLVTRAADVVLKERRRLILVTRDTPLNLIHIENMRAITLAGGIICPASPSFYSGPEDFYQLAATVIDRVLHLAGFQFDSYTWGE
jgi:4-hydroxy-3-polyprenylbenzoate decarboxylase